MKQRHQGKTATPELPDQDPAARPAARPPYEPPRILKKRSLSRATLFTFEAADATGSTVTGDG